MIDPGEGTVSAVTQPLASEDELGKDELALVVVAEELAIVVWSGFLVEQLHVAVVREGVV